MRIPGMNGRNDIHQFDINGDIHGMKIYCEWFDEMHG